MAAGAAGGASTSKKCMDVDVYSDLNQSDEDLDRIAEANDLFDAVLTGSVDQDKKPTKKADKANEEKTKSTTTNQQQTTTNPKVGNPHRKLSLYVGHFPWWTSDRDLISMVEAMGVKDIKEVKFAENRVNGQSRGFAELVVCSDESFKILMEKIPLCELNGERIDCRIATRQNFAMYEDFANKRIPLRVSQDPKDSDSSEKIPSIPQEHFPPPPIPPLFPPHTHANMFPSLPSPFFSQPPPLFPHMPPNIPPPLPHPLYPPPVHATNQPSPSLHVNPALFNPAQGGHSSKGHSQQNHTYQTTSGDYEELMDRNRAVASSAITKAVSGAATGDLRVAMETLLTAIAIIKQSQVYGDERCQALVTSLKDCLVSIQGNYGCRSSSRSRDEDRERSRGRDRERERDRQRDRGRDRGDSSGWDSAGMSRRRREHSRSGERDRDRSREQERHRDQRDRYR